MSESLPTYEVYLDTEGLPLDLTSPVHTADIMYYDTGIWIEREQDRLFVPYRRVQVIRELTDRSAAVAEGTEPEAETVETGETEPTETDPDGRTTEPPSDPVE
ncbi:hypothetical protein HSRCO_0597 [Halanaeroarchaeum sp. HSR-CO]|uniref:hypothetical protein n=1 Tax=Halanaeroarchaeum sp. HSR-CO TaxID=2866382 RepID=UPI00217E28C9|nr:hypothetical protein [Halanaeroarchaeum sp. HSR-CO]UWG46892.1 hypothetical protein HSRCO_0597 [Halanaeroarchaeum sp. HSR-CO]